MGLMPTYKKQRKKNLYKLEITTYIVHTYENQAYRATNHEHM